MSSLRAFAVVSFLVAATSNFGRPLEAGSGPAPYFRPLNSYDRRVGERGRGRAAARLNAPQCSKLLTDFKDGGGRTLESNLRHLGVNPSRYLLQLSFLDGSPLPACRPLSVIMVTTPGVPRVFACPASVGRLNIRLSRIDFDRRFLAEAMVIHEMLRTFA